MSATVHYRSGMVLIPDPLGYMAGSWQGAMSLLVGAAANRSIATGSPVEIADLLGVAARAG